jgi:proteasome assembly chaperone (PAC2) family protein
LGVAKKRGLEAVCIMGEIPVYLQGLPLPYPKASKSVLEVLTASLGVRIEMEGIIELVERSEREVENLYQRFPLEIREQLDKLKYVTYARPAEPGPITEEDKKRILEDIDKFFKKGPKED